MFVARARVALDDEQLPHDLRLELSQALAEIVAFRTKIRELTDRIETIGDTMPDVKHLRTVPGIGVLTATALVAFVGEPRRFRSGRHFASYLGLTPSESWSGFRRRLGRISKRGNTYLRVLLTHGARSRRIDVPDKLQSWALHVELRCGHNKATVALANRLARIAWRVWLDQRAYERLPEPGRPGQGGRH